VRKCDTSASGTNPVPSAFGTPLSGAKFIYYIGEGIMASWMIHLRVAQGIYEKLNLIHKTEFVMGNIALAYCDTKNGLKPHIISPLSMLSSIAPSLYIAFSFS
jgi:hypothetical protein